MLLELAVPWQWHFLRVLIVFKLKWDIDFREQQTLYKRHIHITVNSDAGAYSPCCQRNKLFSANEHLSVVVMAICVGLWLTLKPQEQFANTLNWRWLFMVKLLILLPYCSALLRCKIDIQCTFSATKSSVDVELLWHFSNSISPGYCSTYRLKSQLWASDGKVSLFWAKCTELI